MDRNGASASAVQLIADHARRILTVGDGDFSFSAVLQKSCKTKEQELTATSYDDRETLIKKYGDSVQGNLETLLQDDDGGAAVVLYGVDATSLSKSLLANGVDGRFDQVLIDTFTMPSATIQCCNDSPFIKLKPLTLITTKQMHSSIP